MFLNRLWTKHLSSIELRSEILSALDETGSWATETQVNGGIDDVKIIILNFTGNFFRALKETNKAFRNFEYAEQLLPKTN